MQLCHYYNHPFCEWVCHMRAWSTAPPLAEKVELPHDLNSPLQVQALFDHLSEHLLSFSLVLLQHKCVPDIVCVLYTGQLRDTCRSHLHMYRHNDTCMSHVCHMYITCACAQMGGV